MKRPFEGSSFCQVERRPGGQEEEERGRQEQCSRTGGHPQFGCSRESRPSLCARHSEVSWARLLRVQRGVTLLVGSNWQKLTLSSLGAINRLAGALARLVALARLLQPHGATWGERRPVWKRHHVRERQRQARGGRGARLGKRPQPT